MPRMTRFVLPILFSLFALTACNQAQNTAADFEAQIKEAMEAAKASSGSGSPVIWTLSDDDTDIHILGTVHLLKPELQWQTEEITRAIDTADTIVFEADTSSEAATRDIMRFISTEGMFQDGTQLSSLLNEEQKADLEEVLGELGMPLAAIEVMRPWFAAVQISVLQITQSGYDPESGVETVIEKAPRGKGQSFEYLETVDQQLGLIANLSNEDQIEFLMSSLAPANEGIEYLDLLVSEWADGDVSGISVLMSNDAVMGEAIYDALLVQRNKRWVPQIEAMLDEPGMSKADKRLLIDTLWNIVTSFVELGFNVHPAQQAQEAREIRKQACGKEQNCLATTEADSVDSQDTDNAPTTGEGGPE